MKRLIAFTMVVIVCFGFMVGCTNTPQSSTGTPTTAPQGSEQSAATAVPVSYPLSIKDGMNNSLEIKSEPMKVVSISPTATEIVFALGAGDKLVGRTDYCDFPTEATKVPSVGEMYTPNVETIVSMKPDIIFASTATDGAVINKLKEQGITIYTSDDSKGIDGAYQSIENFGKILNSQEKSTSVVTSMKNHLLYIKGKLANITKRPSVYYVVDFGKEDFTPGKGTFIDEAITLAGGINSGAAADPMSYKFSIEQIIQKNPDIILCPSNPDRKNEFMKSDKYKNLPAVKAGKVLLIDNNKLDRAGPRLIDGIDEISRIIQPDLWQ